MRRFIAITGLVALGAATIAAGQRAPAETEATLWSVDVAHTGINFSVRHFFTPVQGTFDEYEVDLQFDPAILDPDIRDNLPGLPAAAGSDIVPGTPFQLENSRYLD